MCLGLRRSLPPVVLIYVDLVLSAVKSFVFLLSRVHQDLHVLTHSSPTRLSSDLRPSFAPAATGSYIDSNCASWRGSNRLWTSSGRQRTARYIATVETTNSVADAHRQPRCARTRRGKSASRNSSARRDRKSTRLNSSH